MSTLIIRHLGHRAYDPIFQRMKHFTTHRNAGDADELWFLEHEPVFTLGQAGRKEHLIDTGDIPVVRVDRGGQVTYHGPGQLVVYLLIDLKRKNFGVRELVSLIEESIIATLKEQGIASDLNAGSPGVYVGLAKIASLGLRIHRGCSYHGLALNIDMDLSPWKRINPCGYAGLEVVQISDFVVEVDRGLIEQQLKSHLIEKLQYGSVSFLEGWSTSCDTQNP